MSELYFCEDCKIVLPIGELTAGCPKCGETMVPADPENACGHRCGSLGRFKCILPVGHGETDPPQPHHYRGG